MERKIVKEINRYMRLGGTEFRLHQFLGTSVTRFKDGTLRTNFSPAPSIVDRKGNIQQGFLTAGLDAAMFLHLHVQGFLDGSSDIDGSTSLEFEVEFFSPARFGCELFCETEVLRIGQSVAFFAAHLFQGLEQHELIATAFQTIRIFRRHAKL